MDSQRPSFEELEELPNAAKRLIQEFIALDKRVMAEAEASLRPHRVELFRQLQNIQDDLTRAADLDRAVVTRDTIRSLKAQLSPKDLEARPDPGHMTPFAQQEVGTRFLFKVTASRQGPLWGTRLYTLDSSIAVAVVHAGLLRAGEQGVVAVTLEAGQEEYKGSSKNGVTSYDWGPYARSYSVSSLEL